MRKPKINNNPDSILLFILQNNIENKTVNIKMKKFPLSVAFNTEKKSKSKYFSPQFAKLSVPVTHISW